MFFVSRLLFLLLLLLALLTAAIVIVDIASAGDLFVVGGVVFSLDLFGQTNRHT